MLKFDRLLYPELIGNLRGPKTVRDLYKEVLKTVRIIKDSTTKSVAFEILQPGILGQIEAQNALDFITLAKFLREYPGFRTYHFNKSFTEALSCIEREIPVERLPDTFAGYISFPSGALKDESEFVQGAYVFIGKAKETTMSGYINPESKVFWCGYCAEGVDGTQTLLRAELENKTMDQIMKSVTSIDTKGGSPFEGRSVYAVATGSSAIEARARIFNTIINCILYITSSDAVVLKVPSSLGMSNAKAKEVAAQTQIINETAIPVYFANPQYRRAITYSVDETTVRGHFRWQIHGPQRSMHKLIWISEHIRQYKAEDKSQ